MLINYLLSKLDNLPKIFDFGFKNTDKPSVGKTYTINFNKEFSKIPVVIVGQRGYYNPTTIVASFVVSNITTTSFDITICQNADSHSPAIYWIAVT